MFFVGDFHLHSKYSRATSKDMTLENMHRWGQLKGINVLSAADFTHPLWFAELKEKLEPAEAGLFQLRTDISKSIDTDIPESCKDDIRFILTTEISSIYVKNGKTRKIHSIIFAPSLEAVEKINNRLSLIGNLRADGRPILGLDAKELLKIIMDISPQCILVPAHAWTPWFSVFGSNSGFDTLEECFDELTPYIHAIETGLSSDPDMNWRLSQLDGITLISNSDSHSLPRIGRECNVFDTELSYSGITNTFKRNEPHAGKLLMTIEFFPEEGKYHIDGHRVCGVRLAPKESKRLNDICPQCKKKLTIGVLHRVDDLADRTEGFRLPNAPPFKRLVGLQEIIGEAFGKKAGTVGVISEFTKLINYFGNELKILMKTPIEDLQKITNPRVAEGIRRMRNNELYIEPGYDGEYGTVHIFSQENTNTSTAQQKLF